MSDEWGPWVTHDGTGCPCKGLIVIAEDRSGAVFGPYRAHSYGLPFLAGDPRFDAWVHRPKPEDIVRYRVRKPRGATILDEIARNPERELEEA